MADVVPVPCSILRGGTSRALFFLAGDLPPDRRAIEPILLDVMGSPDLRQINGLGGATSQTSKVAIIGSPTRPGADVDYTFAQVSVTEPLVDWGGNCGNTSAAVGPFAIDRGLVPTVEPVTVVRIHNTNTGKLIEAHVPVRDGKAVVEGDYAIPGVPGTGARIVLDFLDPAGAVSGRLLPTGRPRDRIELADGRSFDVSIVDAANPVVFLRASDLGLAGTELPTEIERRGDASAVLEEARSIAAEWLHLVSERRDATRLSPGLPKVGFVAPPQAYVSTTGVPVAAETADLCGRTMSMQAAHRSYQVTAAIATAAASCVPGTLVHEVARPAAERPDAATLRIAHPYGVMEAVVRTGGVAGESVIEAVAIGRTARHILDGQVWVRRRSLVSEGSLARTPRGGA